MQNEKHIICINYETKVDQVMKEKENPSLQTKVSRVSKVIKKRLNTFCKFLLIIFLALWALK
jgi:hypothetical protein